MTRILMNDSGGQRRKCRLGDVKVVAAMLAAVFLSAACTVLPTGLSTELPAAPPAPQLIVEVNDAAEVPGVAALSRKPALLAASAAELMAMRALIEQQDRLYAVGASLMSSSAALCKRSAGNVTGFVARTRYAYPEQLAAAARSAAGLGELPKVMTVFAGSGAAESGLKTGDVLLAIGESKIAPGPNAERDVARMMEGAARDRASLTVTIRRDGAAMTLVIAWSRSCAFKIELGNTDIVNSYTDARRIMITRGMLDFVRSDEELAYVLAKEIAQAALMKTSLPGMRAMIDRLVMAAPQSSARLPSITPYVPVTDSTADKVALYMLLEGGHGIDAAPAFWQRLANEHPADIAYGHTALHPSTSYRLSVIRAVSARIKQKKLNDLPLVP
jgi:hypothetical protein